MSNLSRREFLKIGLIAGTTLGIKYLNFGPILGKLDREVIPYKVEVATGNFIQLFGTHGSKTFGHNTLPKNIFSEIKADAVFLEGSFISGGPYSERLTNQYTTRLEDNPTFDSWTKELYPIFTEQKIPVLFGDLYWKGPLQKGEAVLMNFAESFAAIGGALMLASANKGIQMTRKEFLEKAAGAALALWGFSGIAGELSTNLLRDLPKQSWVEDLRRMASFTEFVHPEDVLVNFRNALIAEKLLYYSELKYKELGRKPNIFVIMGLAHEIMSEYLRGGREFSQNYLGLYPDKFVKHFFGEDNLEKYFSSLFELKPEISLLKVKVFRDPELERRFGLGLVEGQTSSPELR